MSPFPAEIYGHILAQLPPLRDSDLSVYTLVTCSETNSILRYVSISAALWNPHYRIRYRHSDERKEKVRKSRFKCDWRALYFERRRLESRVLETMKDIILGNVGSTVEERLEKEEEREHPVSWLQAVGRSTARLGMDVYDMLDILQRTAPRRFRGAPEEAELVYENPTSPWKSWATCLKGFVLRHDALSRWIRMKDHPEETTFERALAGLSAFYGVSYVEISDALDSLASECRAFLTFVDVPNPEVPLEFCPDDVTRTCEQICEFMRGKGFAPRYGSLVPPEDLFPHRFISIPAARMNIPMPLVYVFVVICRRLGIAASATNFPARALAHVTPGGGVPDFWVDVFDSGTRPIVQHDDMLRIWNQIATFRVAFAEDTQPCTPETSLIRQANNIMASISSAPVASFSSRAYLIYPALSIICFLDTMQWPNGFGIVPDIDLRAILGDLVAPRLHPDNEFHTTLRALMKGETSSYSVCKRGELLTRGVGSPKYFVGRVVCSDEFTAACVIGWFPPTEPGQTDILYKIQIPMEGDPYGEVVSGYQFESELHPANSKRAFDQIRNAPWLGMHFSGTETNSEGLMRLIMNPTLRQRYPEDDEYGRKWLEEGRKIE